ncbi:MAG: TIM barrel protein [Candidatus Pacearchaeota archaeon]|jgi:hypothetical protein
MASYESIYSGSDNFLIPKESSQKYISTGYQSSVSSIGMATDPRTANQLGELNAKLNPGMSHLEVGGISGSVFDSIPEQHLDEMRRLGKLTGVSASVHAPIVEASGIGEKGGWEESNRLGAELELTSALLRSHRIDPKGNISVTVHSTAQLPEMIQKTKAYNPETKKIEEMTTAMWVINPETGKIGPIEYAKRYFPEEGKKEGEFTGKPRDFRPTNELKKLNEDTWTSQLSDINRHVTYGEDILDKIQSNYKISGDTMNSLMKGKINFDNVNAEEFDEAKKNLKSIQKDITHGQIYLQDAYRNLKNVFDSAYANAIKSDNKEDMKKLKEYAEKVSPLIKEGIDKNPEALTEVLDKGVKVLQEIKTPQIWKPLQDFVVEKSAETFANVAVKGFKKFGDTAPILNIENPPAGGGLSRAEDLKVLIEKARETFVEKMKGELGSSEAKNQAEKLIGATWDVGHINMLRKKGYTEKDIVKQSEIIAPYVKHVHLSDNFGLDHTELPMGMGNVPMKEIMEKLGQKGFEGKKIIEAGNWWQYFSEKGGGNPFRPSIEAFDSPLYSMKAGATWSQMGNYGSYFSGNLGPVNPAVHHRLYGAGFENLPMELGGEIPGDRNRFSGTPNQ